MFELLAAMASRRPWRIVVVAVIFAAVAGVLGGGIASVLQAGGFEDSASPSVVARLRMEQATGLMPDGGLLALVEMGQDVRSAASRAEVARVATIIGHDQAIARVLTVYQTQDPAMISADGRSTYVVGLFKPITD